MINPNDTIMESLFSDGMTLRTYIATRLMAAIMTDERRVGMTYEERANDVVRATDILIHRLNSPIDIHPQFKDM